MLVLAARGPWRTSCCPTGIPKPWVVETLPLPVPTKIVNAVPEPELALVRIRSRNPVLVLGTE
jgi:hypothetical protein